MFISLPFRAEGREEEHPGCLRRFDSRHIDRFLAALARELEATAAESDEVQVQEIEVGNGSASHLTADDLTRLFRDIRARFQVSPRAAIRVTVTPAGFDFYKLSAIRQLGNASVCLELPGLTDEALRAADYRCTAAEAEAALDCCFQNGFRHFSVFLTAKDLDAETAERTLGRCLAAHPEQIVLRADAEKTLAETADRVLGGAGWTRAGHRWAREKLPAPRRCEVQIGCGPGAVSVYDGAAIRSTADFDFYCAHADDFEALVTHT